MNTIISIISDRLGFSRKSVSNTVNLLKEGATVPFISRYRKEVTGSLDEVAIGAIQQELKRLEELQKRKETILAAIDEQGKLTDALRSRIENTYDSTILEDIYLPYKKKRKTRAMAAREKGLEPLAKTIFLQRDNTPMQALASGYLTGEVPTIEDALQGARDIIAEWINEDEKARNKVRYQFKKEAVIYSKVARNKEAEGSKYRDYFDFSEALKKCPSHRLLAIRRGEDEGFLRVRIEPDEETALYLLNNLYVKNNTESAKQVKEAVEDCYKRLLCPGIETEFRKSSKEKADKEAIEVFAENLRQLLMSAPYGQHRVLGLDPGFRTGCKLVCLDESGQLLHHTAIYPHPPQSDTYNATLTLQGLVDKYEIEAIAVGNGTAGRETMRLCKGIDFGRPIDVFMVNESGASIYSASPIAREEFPDEDVTVRGAVSIARRLMDPLAELVKIDPKSIGVGQYQHDVNQGLLKESLTREIEHCVNAVGVNLNTASKHLLTYISGLGPTLAQNIVDYRSKQGLFSDRKSLKKVPRMGEKAFEQCAGFLRVKNGKNPLDNTAVHPESYSIVQQMAKDLNCSVQDLIQSPEKRKQIQLNRYITSEKGLPTLKDILKELAKPGLDPRGKAKAFSFSESVKTIDDLEIGMILPGIVNNVTNFGAFVDIGIKESGLVHISQMANRFIKSPSEVVALQQQVMVKVMDIDYDRKRVQLSMKAVE